MERNSQEDTGNVKESNMDYAALLRKKIAAPTVDYRDTIPAPPKVDYQTFEPIGSATAGMTPGSFPIRYSPYATPVDGSVPSTPNVDYRNTIPAASATPTPPTSPGGYQAPQAVDNSGMINTQYGDLITALKAQIQQSVNNKNMSIGGLGEKYQPDKNASEVAKYGQVASLNEAAANAGDRGGIGRQNTLQAMVGGENRLNTINMQQTAEKTALQNDISNLMLEGNIQEAQLQAQKLKDLIANSTNMDNTNYQRGVDTANLTGTMANGQKTMAGQAAELQNALTNLNIDTAKINLAALPQQIQDQAKLVTQQIAKGELDIETGRAQLKELTDPNSMTNQMNRLGLDTAKFNYSQLSIQAQQQAAQVANDLANGVMSRAQAQSAIDHAGDSYAAQMAGLAWDQSPDNPSNQRTAAATNPNANTLKDYASFIDSQYMKDANGNPVIQKSGIQKYLDSLINMGVDPEIIDSLAARYGITNEPIYDTSNPTHGKNGTR